MSSNENTADVCTSRFFKEYCGPACAEGLIAEGSNCVKYCNPVLVVQDGICVPLMPFWMYIVIAVLIGVVVLLAAITATHCIINKKTRISIPSQPAQTPTTFVEKPENIAINETFEGTASTSYSSESSDAIEVEEPPARQPIKQSSSFVISGPEKPIARSPSMPHVRTPIKSARQLFELQGEQARRQLQPRTDIRRQKVDATLRPAGYRQGMVSSTVEHRDDRMRARIIPTTPEIARKVRFTK